MAYPPKRPDVRATILMYGLIPCVLGIGLGQYLRWSGTVWLTDAGGFWPIFCFIASLLFGLYLLLTKTYDRTVRVSAWLMLTWTWLYYPFWLTAVEVPKNAAVVGVDGRVSIANELMRTNFDRLWLFAGRSDNKIVHGVEGVVTINAVDVKYKYADAYIATRRNGEDLSKPVADVMSAALASEARKHRASRIALFEVKQFQEPFLADVCRAAVSSKIPCPLKLAITPNKAATIPGGLWSKHFTEQEALDERNLPALVELLAQDNPRIVRTDAVFALLMQLNGTAADLAKVARKPHLLDDGQFNALIDRLIRAPDAGNEALTLHASVSRLSREQRAALRDKAFAEADVAHIIKHYRPGRISDVELAQLSPRLRPELAADPELAILTLEQFGERLPQDLQLAAVESIGRARATHALSALRHLDFSSPLRAALLSKVVAEASVKELDVNLAHGRFDDLLTPAEARPLIARVIEKSSNSKDWLDVAVRALPVRAMTVDERRSIIDQLMFASTKAAFEFVSENRRYLDATDVRDVTRDYARTVAPDFCLHLTHRNANRQIEYFSEDQLEIFRKCAEAK